MSEEKVITIEGLTNWFKENPTIQYSLPWVMNILSHKEALGKGCKCKHKQKLANVRTVYLNAVKDIIAKNQNTVAILKKEFDAEKLIFKYEEGDEEILLEV
tara:strand:- start:254 stop:556 length:303 start_codon:yes stop_codon:yes gene_type:complete